MPAREPFRTEYIDKLFKEKNIEGLKKEQEAIRRVIQSYATELLGAITHKDKDKLELAIEHEKEVYEKIENYLHHLLNYNG